MLLIKIYLQLRGIVLATALLDRSIFQIYKVQCIISGCHLCLFSIYQKFLKFWNVLNVNGNTSLDRYNNFWHCSKDAYVNSVTELLPVWAAEGRKELTDHRSVWDWIKYNIRAHAINFS